MSYRRALPAGLVAAALALAACSHSSPSSSDTSTTSGPAPTSAHAPAAAARPLAAQLGRGLAGVTSAHLAIDAGALLGTAVGSIKVQRGTVTASDLTVTTGGAKAHVITIAGTSYAHLDGGKQLGPKPWVKVSSTSSNEFVRGLAGNLQLVQSVTSLGEVAQLLGTATSVKQDGTGTVDGVKATHYLLTLDAGTAAKSGNGQLQSLLNELGSGSVPVDLWTDAQHRPVKIAVHLSLAGTKLAVTVDITNYNAPVTITAPPANQVGG